MIKLFTAFLLCFLSLQIYGQMPNEAVFNQKLFFSDFVDADKSLWPAKNNQHYFFMVDKGRYILECKSADKRAYLLPKDAPQLENYKLEANLVFDMRAKSEGSLGLAVALQSNLESGYLFEINADRNFRVRQIAGAGNMLLLTGTEKKQGWKSTKDINKPGKNNKLTIFKNNGKIKFSINNTVVFTMNEEKILTGRNGIFIDGNVKAFANNFALYTAMEKNALGLDGSNGKQEKTETDAQENMAGQEQEQENNQADADINAFSEALLDCRKQNATLTERNENAEAQLKQMKIKQAELEKFIADNLDIKLQAAMEKEKNRADDLQKQNETLSAENKNLKAFKQDILNSAKDADLVIVISENLKKEREKSDALNLKIKQLEAQLSKYKKGKK